MRKLAVCASVVLGVAFVIYGLFSPSIAIPRELGGSLGLFLFIGGYLCYAEPRLGGAFFAVIAAGMFYASFAELFRPFYSLFNPLYLTTHFLISTVIALLAIIAYFAEG